MFCMNVRCTQHWFIITVVTEICVYPQHIFFNLHSMTSVLWHYSVTWQSGHDNLSPDGQCHSMSRSNVAALDHRMHVAHIAQSQSIVSRSPHCRYSACDVPTSQECETCEETKVAVPWASHLHSRTYTCPSWECP